MTTITFACPQCQTNLKTSQRIDVDQEVRCPKCGTVFPAPPETISFGFDDSPMTGSGEVDGPEFSGTFQRRSKPNRTKTIILGSAIIVALFTAGTAYLTWKIIENWGRNEGTGREDPLAFVPPESTLVVGVDMGALADHPDWADQIEKGIRQLNQFPIFWDDCKANTGIEFRELFDQVILAFKLEGLNQNEVPHITLIAHSRLPFNQNRIRDSEKDMYREVSHGKTYYKRNDGNLMDLSWLFMPSDRILVLSSLPEYDFEPLMEKDGSDPLLSQDELRRIRGLQENPFWAAFSISDSRRENLTKSSLLLGKMFPKMAPVLETIIHAKAGSAFARWDEDQMALTMTLDCDEESAARQGSSRLQEYWDKHAKALPIFQALPREALDQAKFSSEGGTIRITTRGTPPPPEKLRPLAIQISFMLGFGQYRWAAPPASRDVPPPPSRKGPRGFGPGGPPRQSPPGKV